MFVNKYSGWANCRSCGASYNLHELFGEKANWIQIQKDRLRAKMQRVTMDSLSYEVPDGAVMYNSSFRGVSAKTMEEFSAFQFSEFPGYLFFPLVSPSQRIVNFIGRDTTGTRLPKYLFLYKKPVMMAPYSDPYYGSIILVEGWFDFLNLYEKGLTNVRAIFGTSFTDEHVNMLKIEGIDEVVVLMDGDSAGEAAADRIKELLDTAYISNKIIKLQSGTDPGKLSLQTVQKLKGKLYGKQSSDSRNEAVFS
jgi:5S rRNA maturation endonuclease (ribonuclease M5)